MSNRTQNQSTSFQQADHDGGGAFVNAQPEDVVIYTNGSITIGRQSTGLVVSQRGQGTVVYTQESPFSGVKYKEHKMPHARYSLACDHPASGVAGRAQFLEDILSLVRSLGRR